MKKSYIAYLIGRPGIGKYTIAQGLSNYGFIVCDNQLINNPIFALLNYKGFGTIPKQGWDAIGKIRSIVFDFIGQEKDHNYVLTNCLYEEVGDKECYRQVEAMALKRGSIFIPVKLSISKDEHLKRITEPSRKVRLKSVDPQEVHENKTLIDINHPNLIELEISLLSGLQVAEYIWDYLNKLRVEK